MTVSNSSTHSSNLDSNTNSPVIGQHHAPKTRSSQSSETPQREQLEATLDRVDGLIREANDPQAIELSIVMPCLNEADTLATCIRKCNQVIKEHDLAAEVIIADNGSSDGSIEIALENGARVVHVQAKGYGSALRGGINAARGKYVIMGDADDSYDFLDIPKFVTRLRQGKQLVQGCRLPSGGGQVLPGAMPFSHRWLGNPMFSAMVKRMFNAPINDVYCGLRGFTKDLYQQLDLRCTGMTFATEMIIKASLFEADIDEVPITLHPDGRKAHAPHLRTFRDGWRTLRFFLVYSPKYLFQLPGIGLLVFGLLAYALALPGVQLFGASLDAHTMLFGTLAILMGYQLLQFAVFSKTFASQQGLIPVEKQMSRLAKLFTLERGLVLGAAMFVGGLGLLGVAVNEWRLANFGPLNYAHTLRVVIPGMTLAAIGFQTIASSFFLGVLKLARRSDD
ncbi:MAG: glycosyltransferase family 2 protein [Pirellulaceae bacterium]|nr:glycosyltransferase family 2 protein [Pirellulaceae bacterium]